MKRITELCEELSIEIEKITGARPQINRAATGTLIDKSEGRLPFLFTKSIIELYQWGDGECARRPVGLLPTIQFLSVKQALRAYQTTMDARAEFSWWRKNWKENWFPVFDDGAGSMWGVRCSENERVKDGAVVWYCHMIGTSVQYRSLEQMLLTYLEACRRGIVTSESRGRAKINDKKFLKLGRDMNPGLKVWQE